MNEADEESPGTPRRDGRNEDRPGAGPGEMLAASMRRAPLAFALHEMIFAADGRPADYRFLDANPAYESLTGLRIAEIRGRTVREVIPGIEERWIEAYGRVVSTGEPACFSDFAKSLGKHFQVWAYRPETGEFAVFVEDITLSIESARSAHDREDVFRRAIETTKDGYFVVDSSGVVRQANGAFCEMSGYSPDELVGMPLERLEGPEQAKGILDLAPDIRAGGHAAFESRYRRKDGSVLEAEFTVGYIDLGGGSFVCFARDIGSRKAAERASDRRETMLRAVLGAIENPIAFRDADGCYLGCNRAYERIFGRSEEWLEGKTDAEIFDEGVAAKIRSEDREILRTGRPLPPDLLWILCTDGRERLYERHKVPLTGEAATAYGVAVLWRDRTKEIHYARASELEIGLHRIAGSVSSRELILKATEELRKALGCSSAAVAVDAAGNGGGADRGRPEVWLGPLGPNQAWRRAAGADDPSWARTLWERCAARRESFVARDVAGFPCGNGGADPAGAGVGILVLPVSRGGRVAGFACMWGRERGFNEWDQSLAARAMADAWEIGERLGAEEEARDNADQRDLALDAMRAGIETWDSASGLMRCDDRWAAIVGYALAELPGYPDRTWELLCHPEDLAGSVERQKSLLSGASSGYDAEVRLRHRDGRWIWVLERARVVRRGSAGEPPMISGLIIDITAIKEAEEKLRLAVREKDILLQELFHRTKNNLQLINAMLELKKDEMESRAFRQAIEAVQTKILAMALVQEKLYRAGDLSVLDLGEYISDLVGLIQSSSPMRSERVRFSRRIQRIPVSIDAAIPCGLIASELISNSLAHAFPFDAEGEISVAVSSQGEDIVLEMGDDGVGLPRGLDVRSNPHMGLKTVIGIGEEQLHGKVEFLPVPRGVSCRLKFKDIYYPRRV